MKQLPYAPGVPHKSRTKQQRPIEPINATAPSLTFRQDRVSARGEIR